MITRLTRIAMLGLLLGLVAHFPFATTAGSPPGGASWPRGLLHVAADAAQDASYGNLSQAEQKFVENAHARGLLAIGAGHVAFEASSIREVRLLAAHTLAHRVGVDEKLANLAKAKGMAALSDQIDAATRETLETLHQASGDDDFELRYCGMVVAVYLRELRAFQDQAENATDPQLRKLAAEVAAELKQHLAIALVVQHALASALNEAPATITVSHPVEATQAPVKA